MYKHHYMALLPRSFDHIFANFKDIHYYETRNKINYCSKSQI